MGRALITAPVARDLFAESGVDVVKVPGATNGTLQAWDTLNADYFVALGDAQLTIYTTLQSIPPAVRKYIVQFVTYPTVAALSAGVWKRWIDCTAADFLKTNNGVKAVTLLVAGDHPTEMDLLHHWLGNVNETLGTVSA